LAYRSFPQAAGISLEVCAAFLAITAVGKGLDAYVAVDASGTFSETKRKAGLLRMLQAGVILSDYATLMVEILEDNARPEAGAVYGALDMPWVKLVGQIKLTASNERAQFQRIAQRCGFGSEETMRRSFLRLIAATPQDYRARFSA
jgi:hypothetical protein